MATYEQAMEALRAADKAGNTEDAKRLAEIAVKLKPAAPSVDPDIPQPSAPMTPPTQAEANPAISPQAGSPDAPMRSFGSMMGSAVEGEKQAIQGTGQGIKSTVTNPKLSLGEKALNIGGDALGGAAANLAAVPVLGGVGKAASLVPKMGEFGRAVSGVSSAMKAQGPAALATEGAAIGGTMRSVIDMLKERYKLSEETANNLVMAASMSPVAAQKAWAMLPTTAKTKAVDIIKSAHGAGTDMITGVQQKNMLQKILDNLGMGGTLKEETNPLNAALESAAKVREGEIGKEGKEIASGLEKEAGVMGRVSAEAIPQQTDLLRERRLGPDTTKSEVADEIRMLTLPEAEAAAKNRQQEGRQGWDNFINAAEQKRMMGEYPNQTLEAQSGINHLNSLIEPGADGVAKVPESNPIYRQLKNWRDRLAGEKVAPLPVKPPVIRNLLSEYNSKLRKMGGYMSEDELREWMVQENWLPEHVAANAAKNKPGGDLDAAKAVLKQAQDNRANPKQTDPVIHQDDASDWATYQYETQQWNSAVAAAPKRTLAEEYDAIRREANQLVKDAKGGLKGIIETEARKVSETATKALEEYVPGYSNKRLIDYRDAAQEEAEFKTRLAKILNERDPSDPAQMKAGAHRVTEALFAGRDPAMAFKRMIGGDQGKFDKIGLAHINTSLAGKDATAAERWWKSSEVADWKGELSDTARQKVDAYIKDLHVLDAVSKRAGIRERSTVGQLEALPGVTGKKVEESNKLLLGTDKPVDRIKKLFLTGKQNTDEVRAVWDSVKNQPGGREAFSQAVESVLKEEMQGTGGKSVLETFDNRIADVLSKSGAYSEKEVKDLRKLVESASDILNTKVASMSDYKDLIRDATNDESIKRSAWAGLAGALSGAATGGTFAGIPGGVSGGVLGGLVAGKEAMGIFTAGGYARYQKYIEDAISKIIADPELFKAAIAPDSPYSSKRLMGLLAAKSAQAGAISGANRLESPIQKRAAGGPVNPNQPYVVGENGPEVIVPKAPGMVIPQNRLQKITGTTGDPVTGFKGAGLNPDGSYGPQAAPAAPIPARPGGADDQMIIQMKQRMAAQQAEQRIQALMKLRGVSRPVAQRMIVESMQK